MPPKRKAGAIKLPPKAECKILTDEQKKFLGWLITKCVADKRDAAAAYYNMILITNTYDTNDACDLNKEGIRYKNEYK